MTCAVIRLTQWQRVRVKDYTHSNMTTAVNVRGDINQRELYCSGCSSVRATPALLPASSTFAGYRFGPTLGAIGCRIGCLRCLGDDVIVACLECTLEALHLLERRCRTDGLFDLRDLLLCGGCFRQREVESVVAKANPVNFRKIFNRRKCIPYIW